MSGQYWHIINHAESSRSYSDSYTKTWLCALTHLGVSIISYSEFFGGGTCGGQRSTWESQCFPSLLGYWEQTQVVHLGGKQLYLLSCLTGLFKTYFSLLIYILCMCMFCLHVCMSSYRYVPGALRIQKRILDPLEMEVQEMICKSYSECEIKQTKQDWMAEKLGRE